MHWTDNSSLDSWFAHRWEFGKILDLVEGRTAVLPKCPLGDVPLVCQALQSCPVRFAVDWLLSMDEACQRGLGSDGTLGWLSAVMDGKSLDDELVPYPDDDDYDD